MTPGVGEEVPATDEHFGRDLAELPAAGFGAYEHALNADALAGLHRPGVCHQDQLESIQVRPTKVKKIEMGFSSLQILAIESINKAQPLAISSGAD
jgi:hypothetical protein